MIMALASRCLFGCGGLRNARGSSYNCKLLKLGIGWLDGGVHPAAGVKFLSSRVEGGNNGTGKVNERFPCGIKSGLVDGTLAQNSSPNVDSQKHFTPDYRSLAKRTAVIVFDLETTGLSPKYNRILEIAFRDLHGGKNSTFQSLVNPETLVFKSDVHSITSQMVESPNVPTFKELIPYLMAYVESRQLPGGIVLFVAHNARSFDVRFLIGEFKRCSMKIPDEWYFVDTLPLARKVMELEVAGSAGKGCKLDDLKKHFDIPSCGQAHRAMPDVHALAHILQRLSLKLELPLSGLLERSFKASDLVVKNPKKKNS